MDKKVITSEKGFYDPELCIRFMQVKASKTSYIHGSKSSADYKMVLITRGNFEILCNNKVLSLKSGDVFIAKPYEDYRVKCFESEEILSFTVITFHQNLFKEVKGDNKFLRAFDNFEKNKLNVYKSEILKSFSVCEIADLLSLIQTKILDLFIFTRLFQLSFLNLILLTMR